MRQFHAGHIFFSHISISRLFGLMILKVSHISSHTWQKC